MAKNLVIVESPAKAGTINKYLGPDYEVMASMGHVRDLPASKMGVAVEEGFLPQYVIPPKARKTITSLKNALKGKQTVYLATDLDREGEAIAWHISQVLDLKKQGVEVKRITFDEITKQAITSAIEKPTDIDDRLVDAQQARRVLDRLVGYTLSPVLWKKIYKGLSAGRVQSVALRLVVDRERERDAFQPVEYWSLKASLSKTGEKESFMASLSEYRGTKIEQLTLKTKEETDAIVKEAEKAAYSVTKVDKKQVKRRPSAPYTTSTLQQDAVNRLGISSKRLMQIAQRLYEGGHITYMRTDSVAIASTAIDALREYIGETYGSQYLPDRPHTYQAKAKNAQEAHEAIRPTDPCHAGSDVSDDPAAQKVYELIRSRTLACQMKEAELEQTAATIAAGEAVFRATGQRIVFPGFLKVWKIEEKEENILPELNAGLPLQLRELLPEQHFTEPPPRYSEATIIKSLEEQGIGRPSTYAPTIDTLIQRRYVRLEQRRFVPEEVGYLVTDLLVKHFPEIVNLAFTADMESKLDRIADGEADYAQTLSDFWKPFSATVEQQVDLIEKVNTSQETDVLCPECHAPMVIKMGRFGKFLACSRFPDCKTTQPLPQENGASLICPVCGKPLFSRKAKRGIFFGCSGYPACTFAVWKKEQLAQKIGELEAAGTEVPFKEQALASLAEQQAE